MTYMYSTPSNSEWPPRSSLSWKQPAHSFNHLSTTSLASRSLAPLFLFLNSKEKQRSSPSNCPTPWFFDQTNSSQRWPPEEGVQHLHQTLLGYDFVYVLSGRLSLNSCTQLVGNAYWRILRPRETFRSMRRNRSIQFLLHFLAFEHVRPSFRVFLTFSTVCAGICMI